ncbi:hypothetical protein KFK09_007293 [Dendrobium nobile]|uniref:Uncharacterized protein n=1 Tax=Dendrobium nobile TaxID=94219 RepID=A0A8T3BRH4_DENNO|nr:hypothetical protein KFK09_007293 [Dendrobium nobile]
MQDLSSKHPISSIPFETYYRGSWHGTELVSIINGKTFVCIHHEGLTVEEEICGDYIRLRSRKANACDCLNLLKVGADVCVLSACWISESTDHEAQQTFPRWYDAKIVSKSYNPHEGECSCLFSVMLYKKRATNGVAKNIHFDRTETVTIDKIAILQKLNDELCVDGFYRWRCSKDCTAYSRSKLLSGLFSSQISWLVVLSVLKGMRFHIKSVHRNLVYQILEREQKSVDPPNSDENINIMHFKLLTEHARPLAKKISPFVLSRSMEAESPLRAGTNQERKESTEVDSESDIEVLYDRKSLRRSRRQKIQPDRLSYSSNFHYNSKRYRARHADRLENIIYKHQKIQPDHFTSYSSTTFDYNLKRNRAPDVGQMENRKQKKSASLIVEKYSDNSEFCHASKVSGNVECAAHVQTSARKKFSDENFKEAQSQNPLRRDLEQISEENSTKSHNRLKEHGVGKLIQPDCLRSYSSTNFVHNSKRNRARDVDQLEHRKQKRLTVEEQDFDDYEFCHVTSSSGNADCAAPLQISTRKNLSDENFNKFESDEIHEELSTESQNRPREHGLGDLIQPDHSTSYSSTNFDHKSKMNEVPNVVQLEHRTMKQLACDEQYCDNSEFCNVKTSSGYVECAIPLQTSATKKLSDENFKEVNSQNPGRLDAEEICELSSNSQDMLKDHGLGEGPRRRGRPRLRDKKRLYSHCDNPLYQKKSSRRKLLSALECMELIQECMGSIKAEMEVKFQQRAQPENTLPEGKEDFIWSTTPKDQIEVEEHEDLWKEMEHLLTKLALLEQKQDLDSESVGGIFLGSDKASDQVCKHDFKLDEQVGIICRFCNFVHTDIRNVMPPFMTADGRMSSNKEYWGKEGFLKMSAYILKLSNFDNSMSHSNLASFGGNDTIWALIPDLKLKLYDHQKKAFEFIWRNIAGSLNPKDMEVQLGSTGGCIISHTPGSGKTFLMISFIVSYLTLFPKSRPLVLVPKIAICVWRKEFEKWGVQFPLHIMHPVNSYRKETLDCKTRTPFMDQRKPNMKISHVMDCLTKLHKWHEEPSILLMSYSSFSSMQKDSKLEHKKFMARVLQESPGLLILDEGHNPRSTNSKLRNLIMEVKTKSRVLLSGTLFQNNFEEYFNTLCLARPTFVDDVLWELDPEISTLMSSRSKISHKRSRRKEKLARKIFVQRVGEKISSSMEDERKHGFDVLNNITSGFIDIYDNDNSNKLPRLQIYTLVLMPTDIQNEILSRLQTRLKQLAGHPIGLELLISVGSIHPCLINTMTHANEFYSDSELKNIDKHKENMMCGSKMKFVFDLVHKSSIRGEKVLIFSHNISPISLLVKFFENLLGWHKGDEVLVLQGDQELSLRAKIMEKFNGDVENKCKLLIASTSACAEGISLTAASRVVLLDSEWNHSKTRQAIARAFRPGQERDVYVYKLLASGTWEEDKYRSNEWKAWLSKMIYIGQYIDHNSCRKVDVVEDALLRELVEEDQGNMFKMIMKQD